MLSISRYFKKVQTILSTIPLAASFASVISRLHGPCFRSGGLVCAGTEIGGDDAGIASHLPRRVVGDDVPELQHDHPVADAQHEPHVVLDQQHGLPLIGQRAQALAKLRALRRVQAGGGLIQAQQARPGGERAGDSDQLALTR